MIVKEERTRFKLVSHSRRYSIHALYLTRDLRGRLIRLFMSSYTYISVAMSYFCKNRTAWRLLLKSSISVVASISRISVSSVAIEYYYLLAPNQMNKRVAS